MEQAPDAGRRAAETKAALGEALVKLGESAPLAVRNIAFCTEIQSYGCTKRFEKYEFQPNQEVLLYAEVENFTSEPTPKGYHTSLRSNYQILDARGQRVAEHAFADDGRILPESPPRFLHRLPSLLAQGHSAPASTVCGLSIEDLKSRKAGRGVDRVRGQGARGKDTRMRHMKRPADFSRCDFYAFCAKRESRGPLHVSVDRCACASVRSSVYSSILTLLSPSRVPLLSP